MPDFHGYGYQAWAGGPGSGFNRLSGGRGHMFHQGSWMAGAAHKLQSPVTNPAGTVTAHPLELHLARPKPGEATLLTPQAFPWMSKLGGATRRNRSQVFQSYPQPQAPQPEQGALGRGPQPAGALGYRRPGHAIGTVQRGAAIGGRAAPARIGQATIRGALPSGPLGLPVGSRPMGGPPKPLALTTRAGATPSTPGRRRRQEVFGQMMFGEA